MATSSHLITHSRIPTTRRFASSSVYVQSHAKPSLYRTTTTKGNVLPYNFIDKRITPTEYRSCIVKATADDFPYETQIKPQPKSMSLIDWVLYLQRPFVLLSATIGLGGSVTRLWMENPHLLQASNWLQLSSTLFLVLLSICLTDGFIHQINNIYDVDLDRYSKSHLPLPSGAVSLSTAWILVIGAVVASIGIAALVQSQAFLLSIVLNLILGFIYSVPPFWTKRNTYGAILTIATMAGFFSTLQVYAGATTALGLKFQLSPALGFLVIFRFVFALALGMMKDLHDVEGDTLHNVPTLASKYGLKPTAYVGFGLIFLSYIGAIAAGFLYPNMFNQKVMVSAHFVILHWVAFQAWNLNKRNYKKEANKSFYLMMWNALSLEFVIYPFI